MDQDQHQATGQNTSGHGEILSALGEELAQYNRWLIDSSTPHRAEEKRAPTEVGNNFKKNQKNPPKQNSVTPPDLGD